MDIKICTKNLPKLDAALAVVNGKAKDHTYSGYDLLAVAAAAEAYALSILKNQRWVVLAQWESESGSAVSNAYKYSRISTIVRIKRGKSGWYLVDAKASTLYSKGGTSHLILTVVQANHAASLAAQRYVVKGSNGT